jgi:hypothetical protein
MQRERRSLLGKHRIGWEESIEIDLQGTRWEAVDWIDLAPVMDNRRAVLNKVTNFQGHGAVCSEHVNRVPGTNGGLL